MNFEEIKETIRAGVVIAMDFSRELTDEEVLSLIDEGILKFETRGSISLGERIRLKREIFNSLRKLDIIQEYLEDDRVTEPCTLMKIPAKPRRNRAFQRLSNF